VPTEKYKAKGKYSVNIIYHLTTAIHNKRQICDIRHYNTEKEKEEYIEQSIDTYSNFANKYNTQIIGLKVDNHFWNINRIAEAFS